MSNPTIEVKIEPRAGANGTSVVLAAIAGKITVDECEQFSTHAHAITEAGPNAAVIDCAGLTFLSSAGIGELIKLNRSLRERKASMMLANVQPEVRKIFEASKLDEMMPIYASVDEAMLRL